jgi:hypothetical protein
MKRTFAAGTIFWLGRSVLAVSTDVETTAPARREIGRRARERRC